MPQSLLCRWAERGRVRRRCFAQDHALGAQQARPPSRRASSERTGTKHCVAEWGGLTERPLGRGPRLLAGVQRGPLPYLTEPVFICSGFVLCFHFVSAGLSRWPRLPAVNGRPRVGGRGGMGAWTGVCGWWWRLEKAGRDGRVGSRGGASAWLAMADMASWPRVSENVCDTRLWPRRSSARHTLHARAPSSALFEVAHGTISRTPLVVACLV